MKKEYSSYETMDKTLHATMSKLTSGLSPSALMAAYTVKWSSKTGHGFRTH